MAFATRPYLVEEEPEDYTDVPLKLHSLMEFLDDGHFTSTECQHVSSNESEEDSEVDFSDADVRRSLRLAPQPTTAVPIPPSGACYCLDKAHCMCGQFKLPPLLTRNTVPALRPLPRSGLTTSGPVPAEEAPAAKTSTRATTTAAATPAVLFGDSMYIPLGLPPVKLTAPMPVMTMTTTCTTTCTTTGCRC